MPTAAVVTSLTIPPISLLPDLFLDFVFDIRLIVYTFNPHFFLTAFFLAAAFSAFVFFGCDFIIGITCNIYLVSLFHNVCKYTPVYLQKRYVYPLLHDNLDIPYQIKPLRFTLAIYDLLLA